MPLAAFLILPLALLAWPCRHWWIASPLAEQEAMHVGAAFDWERSMASMAILCLLVASAATLYRIISRTQSRSRIHGTLSNPFFWGWSWVLLQPLVLSLSHWTDTIEHLHQHVPSVAMFLCLAMMPGCCLFLAIGLARWRSMSMLPMIVILLLALGMDAANAIGSNYAGAAAPLLAPHNPTLEIHRDAMKSLWSWPTQDKTTLAGMIMVLIVSGLLGNLLLPRWIVWCTRSELLSDEQSGSIRDVWSKVGLPLPAILLWPTGCRFSNAVLTGNALSRRLLLTDRLLLQFTEREIQWIVLHEAAHALRYHAWIRWIPSILVLPMLALAIGCTDEYIMGVLCIGLSLLFAGLLVATCWWTEFDADRHAFELGVGVWGIEPEQAAREYANVIEKLYRDNRIQRTSWSHPSLEHRLKKLLPNTEEADGIWKMPAA